MREAGGERVLLEASNVRPFDEESSGTFATWATEYDNEVYLANVAHWLNLGGGAPVASSTRGGFKLIHHR